MNYSELKLPELKIIALSRGITLERVRYFGSGSLRTSWIAALNAVPIVIDTIQEFTNETQDQTVAIVSPVVAIVTPMVDATQTAIEVSQPTVKRVVTVVKRVVTVDNAIHLACVSFVLLHFIYILSYETGKIVGDYYRSISPLDPYGRVMQITADIGRVIHRADPRSVCVDWEDYDRLSNMARGTITIGYEVCGIVAVVAPMITGIIIYRFTSATECALQTVYINSNHYVATRDVTAF